MNPYKVLNKLIEYYDIEYYAPEKILIAHKKMLVKDFVLLKALVKGKVNDIRVN